MRGMMHHVARHNALRFTHVVAAGVQVAVVQRKITAADLDTQLVTCRKIAARLHRLERDLVNLTPLHPHLWFVIALAVAHALNIVVDIPRRSRQTIATC